jgi:uridylate kinase
MWRGRDAAENNVKRTTADSIGMLGTIMNALAVENALNNQGVKAITLSSVAMPSLVKSYTVYDAVKYLEEGYVVICAGGTGLPFFSTDTASALRAAELSASKILMAKNGTDGVYDSDPRKNANAKKYSRITFDEILNKHLEVMDQTCASICCTNKIDVYVFDMNVEGNIKKVLTEPTIGTVVTIK